MSTTAFYGAIELGLLLGLVAIAVFVSFRILDFPDLTVEGSFPLGAAVAAVLVVNLKVDPFTATAVAVTAGAAAGTFTGLLHTRLQIIPILAGILMMTALYSVNLRIMGRPNVALLGEGTVFTSAASALGLAERPAVLITLMMATLASCALLAIFLLSRFGLALRAAGANSRMARANGVDDGQMIVVGLAISNGFAALAGALFAQAHGAADATMGFGIIVIGLASLIVGEGLLPSRRIVVMIAACLLGSLLYRLAVSLALNTDWLGLKSQDLSLVTAVMVAAAVVVGRARRQRQEAIASRVATGIANEHKRV
jgi:putative tryptophan/tyrosine transport system permease protein